MADNPFSEDDLLSYIRGSASPELSARIDATAAQDPSFKAEIALMRGLGPAIKSDDTRRAATEFGWRRLEKAIRNDSARRPATAPRQMVIWRAAAAILVVAVLGQAGYIITQPGLDDPIYRTASGDTEDHVLAIAYAPDATAGAIADLLRTADARVIDGPSAIGLYRVAFPTPEARDDALAQFQTSSLIDIVAEE